jgi:hypothetical protein
VIDRRIRWSKFGARHLKLSEHWLGFLVNWNVTLIKDEKKGQASQT